MIPSMGSLVFYMDASFVSLYNCDLEIQNGEKDIIKG
jgi:hypothetical protein